MGVSEHIGQEVLMGRDIPHFRQFIKRELEKELQKDGPTPPDSATTETSMVVTHAQLLQQTALKKEERLKQEHDRAILTELYPVDDGTQAEGTELAAEEDPAEASGEDQTGEQGAEGLEEEDQPKEYPAEASGEDQTGEQGAEGLEEEDQPKEYPAEASGEDQVEEQSTEGDGALVDPVGVLAEVLTRAKWDKAQRYDQDLKSIRVKAEKASESYFWWGGLLMREPYQPLGKSLLIILTIARQRVLTMAHNSPMGGHFGRECTLQSIRMRMNWPGVVRDINKVCASRPTCQKASPASTTKAPLHPLPVMKGPLAQLAMDIVGLISYLIPKFYIEKLKEIMWRIIWNPAPHSARVKIHSLISVYPSHLTSKSQDS